MIVKTSGGYKATTESGRPLSKKPKSKTDAQRQLRAVEASKARHGTSRHALASTDTLNVLRKNMPMEAVPVARRRKKSREKASRYLHLLKGRSDSYTRRYAKAGAPTTCGNSRSQGKFTPQNVCATGRTEAELNDEASERAKRWVETPAGKAAIAASKAPIGRRSVGPFGKALKSVGVDATPEQVARIASIYFAVYRESKRAAHGDPSLTRAINGIDVSVLGWLGGHVSDLGDIGEVIGKIPMGALAYMLQSDTPSLKTAKRARVAVRETMKRIKSSGKDEPAKFRRIKHTDAADMKKAAEHIKKYGDYYFALLLAALELSFGDLKVSVRVADHAYQGNTAESPRPVSRNSAHPWEPRISRHTKLSPGKPVTGQRIKAGSPGDCGHRPVSGHFDSKNTCSIIHGRLAAREKAAGITSEPPKDESPHETGETRSQGPVLPDFPHDRGDGPVGFVKAAYGRVKALFGKAGPRDRSLLRRAADALKGAYAKLRRGKDAEREMRIAADVLRVEERKVERHRFSKTDDCGHDPSGDFSRENECATRGGGSHPAIDEYKAKLSDATKSIQRARSPSKADAARKNAAYYGWKLGELEKEHGGAKTIDPKKFTENVNKAIGMVDRSRRRGSREHKMWIKDVFDSFNRFDKSIDYDEFKGQLVQAARRGEIEMSRHDLVQALSPSDLKTMNESTIHPLGKEKHGSPELHYIHLKKDKFSSRRNPSRFSGSSTDKIQGYRRMEKIVDWLLK